MGLINKDGFYQLWGSGETSSFVINAGDSEGSMEC